MAVLDQPFAIEVPTGTEEGLARQLENIKRSFETLFQQNANGNHYEFTSTGLFNTFTDAAIGLLDTNGSHYLRLDCGSDLTADRQLSFVPGDAARTVTISGDTTISQDYSTAGSPQFTGLTVTGTGSITGALNFDSDACRLADTNASHYLILTPGSDLTANRVLTLTTGDAARTVTLDGSPTLNDWFDQSVKTTASPSFVAPIFTTAAIIGAASTAGVRLDLESGVLAVREGDDSAYGELRSKTGDFRTTVGLGGSASTANTLVLIGQSTNFAGSAGNATIAANIDVVLEGQVGMDIYGANWAPQYATAASGTHSLVTAFRAQGRSITINGSAVVTSAATIYISDTMAGATNNYAFFSDAGLNRFDGNGTHVFELPADATDPTGGGGAAAGRIPVTIGGATRYLAYY